LHLKGGKIVPRELTEEEKVEAEAAKSKYINKSSYLLDKKPGAPPGKDDKGKKPGEEVISPEQQEKMEKEAREREEKQAAFAKYWEEQLSEQERF
jgi:hypothetical protein